MKRMLRVAFLTMTTLLLAQAAPQAGQTPPPPPPAKSTTTQPNLTVDTAFLLEFTISEWEFGRKTVSRAYSMLVGDGRDGSTRIGNRVPISDDSGKVVFFDVGVKIDARPRAIDSRLVSLRATVESDSVVAPVSGTVKAPVTRFIRNGVEMAIPLDKSTMLFSQEEPGTRITYQVHLLVHLVKNN